MGQEAELLVFSRALPGREDDYAGWYLTQHLPDMRRVPGVRDGAFFRTSGGPEAAWAHLARYRLEAPSQAVLPAVFARAGKADMPLTDAIDPASVLMVAATALGKWGRPPAGGTGDLYLVLSNPVRGEEEAYRRWYDEQHVPDVLAVDGVEAAGRYSLAPETAGRACGWAFAALYDLAPHEGRAVGMALRDRAGGPAMPISPALDRESAYAAVFERLA